MCRDASYCEHPCATVGGGAEKSFLPGARSGAAGRSSPKDRLKCHGRSKWPLSNWKWQLAGRKHASQLYGHVWEMRWS